MFYVYVHKRLSDKKVFYVGKGTKKRVASTCSRNPYWYHTVNKHGFIAIISKAFECEKQAFEYEIKLIKYYRSKKAPLVNIELGGLGGTKGRDMTACMEAARKAKLGVPTVHSEETRKKISEAIKGRRLSEDHVEKLRLAMTGRPVKNSTRKKLSEAYKKRKERGYVQKAWNKGLSDIYTVEQREQIRNKVKEHALKRLEKKGYYGGVGFHKYSGKWRAYIVESHLGVKKQISKGLYDTKKEAIKFLKENYPVL